MKFINTDDIKYQMLYKENFLAGTGVEALAVWKSDIDAMPAVDAVDAVPVVISIYRRYKEDWYCADGERKDNE